MRLRCPARTWVAFGHVRWGSTCPPFGVAMGSEVYADRIEASDDERAPWHVSSPVYIETPERQVVIYTHGETLHEDVIEAATESWRVWSEAMGVEEVTARTP